MLLIITMNNGIIGVTIRAWIIAFLQNNEAGDFVVNFSDTGFFDSMIKIL